MNTEILLFFYSYNSLDYWFRQIATYLHQKQIECKVKKYDRTIEIGNIKLIFAHLEDKIAMTIGRHNCKSFFGLEVKLEKDFEGTLKEILS